MNARSDSTLALLAWYGAMGADEAVAAEPTDWSTAFRHPPPEPPKPAMAEAPVRAPRPTPSPPRRAEFAPMAPDAAVTDAGARARGAATLEALEAALADFTGCPLKVTAKNTCFARGSPHAPLMLIGEAPGRDEDLQGKPFVGRAGRLLDSMLAAIGQSEGDVYITNIVYWRPPGNRTPTTAEVDSCLPFLTRQIELLDPRIVVLVGGPAAANLLGTREGIMRLRGKWRDAELGGKSRRVMPMLHPAYLLRNPAAKRLAWRDMLAIEEALNAT